QNSMPLYEQSLRTRVDQFYADLQMGKYADAEKLVTDATKANFRERRKNPFLSFGLDAIRFDPPGSSAPQKAEVTVKLEVFTPGSTVPIRASETTNWVANANTWELEQPKVV